VKLLALRQLPAGYHLEFWQATAEGAVSLVARGTTSSTPVWTAEVPHGLAEQLAAALPEPQDPNRIRTARRPTPDRVRKALEVLEQLRESFPGDTHAALDYLGIPEEVSRS